MFTTCLVDLFFELEDRGDMFFRNFGWISVDYTALYPRWSSSLAEGQDPICEACEVRWLFEIFVRRLNEESHLCWRLYTTVNTQSNGIACIREVFSSNLGLDTSCPEIFNFFLQCLETLSRGIPLCHSSIILRFDAIHSRYWQRRKPQRKLNSFFFDEV
jgi:hypothetical protein